MDKDGYPTDETLEALKEWEPVDFQGLAEFLVSKWKYEDYISLKDGVLRVSTGGWSGHEEMLSAINPMWEFFHFHIHKVGGHYEYRSKDVDHDTPSFERKRGWNEAIDACIEAYYESDDADPDLVMKGLKL